MRETSLRLQRALLPRNAPTVTGYDIAAGTAHEPEGHGGSLWDWFALPDGRHVLATLHTSPGELPAAHGLALTRAFLREIPADRTDVRALLGRVNTAVTRTAPPGLDGQVDCGVLVLGGGGIAWLGAGAVMGIVIRREGTVEGLAPAGPPLGLMDGFRYGASDVRLNTGDVAMVLSHGGRGLLKGAADVVAELHGRPAGDVVARLQRAIGKVGEVAGPHEHSVLFVRKC